MHVNGFSNLFIDSLSARGGEGPAGRSISSGWAGLQEEGTAPDRQTGNSK